MCFVKQVWSDTHCLVLCFAIVILSTLCCQYARIIPLLIFVFPSLCHQAKLFFYFPAFKIKWSFLLTSYASNHVCPKLLKPSHPIRPLGLPSISALRFPHLLLNLVYDSKFCSGTRTRTPLGFLFPTRVWLLYSKFNFQKHVPTEKNNLTEVWHVTLYTSMILKLLLNVPLKIIYIFLFFCRSRQ